MATTSILKKAGPRWGTGVRFARGRQFQPAALRVIAVLIALAIVAAILVWRAAQNGPTPIRYGHDVCAYCGMTITQTGSAGELRDHTGRLTKYDDIGCLVRAMVMRHRGQAVDAWVEDHSGGGFVPLRDAIFVRSERHVSPMGCGIVAFARADDAEQFAVSSGGRVITVEEFLRVPEQFAPPRGGAPRAHGEDLIALFGRSG